MPSRRSGTGGASGRQRSSGAYGLSCGRFHVSLGATLHHHEPTDRFADRRPDRQESVVAEDDSLTLAEGNRDPASTVGARNVDLLVIKNFVIVEKGS